MTPPQSVALTTTQLVSLVAASVLSGRDIVGLEEAGRQGSISQAVDLAFQIVKKVSDDNRNPDKEKKRG